MATNIAETIPFLPVGIFGQYEGMSRQPYWNICQSGFHISQLVLQYARDMYNRQYGIVGKNVINSKTSQLKQTWLTQKSLLRSLEVCPDCSVLLKKRRFLRAMIDLTYVFVTTV